MMYTLHYDSPLGGILLAADEVGLTGLWFDGEKYFADTLDPEHKAQETPILREAKRWLDVYFRGQEPDFTPPLHPIGSPLPGRKSGRFCSRSPTARPRPTAHWQSSWRRCTVFPGCRHRPWVGGRAQRDLHPHPLPPGRRHQRQPDRLCRRHRQKSRAAETGNENDAVRNAANEKSEPFPDGKRFGIFLVWWRRWESNPCPKRAQCRCLRVQAIYNIPAAPRRSSG